LQRRVVKLGWEQFGDGNGQFGSERKVKYLATFFNNCGVAAFLTGAVLPAFQEHKSFGIYAFYFGMGCALALMCVVVLQLILSELKE
jgi:hypothetical protein